MKLKPTIREILNVIKVDKIMIEDGDHLLFTYPEDLTCDGLNTKVRKFKLDGSELKTLMIWVDK